MSKRILLVDDDVDYRMTMELQLKSAGYDVVALPGAKEARTWLETERPDAAVLDLMMEETDAGFALCFDVKKRDASIPVILVSAVTSETGLDFHAGSSAERSWIKADAFLAKPVRFEQLQRELQRLLPAN